jgi:hypothetical protein
MSELTEFLVVFFGLFFCFAGAIRFLAAVDEFKKRRKDYSNKLNKGE